MVNKSEFKYNSPTSFPETKNMNLLFNSDIVNILLKPMWGEKEGLMLFWIALIVGGRVVRWEILGFIHGWGMQVEPKILHFCFC